ncbi:MAG: threonine synthase, partial [Bacteroidia bacterium]|nr:threonine synthase [Bacteroidia bacterium]
GNDIDILRHNLVSYSYSDKKTREALKTLYDRYGYIADPHGAVGYLGAMAYLKKNRNDHCVFLETAHPTKFIDVVEETIDQKLDLPPQIASVMDKTKSSIRIKSYSDLKGILMS